jgi:hypothetical protein
MNGAAVRRKSEGIIIDHWVGDPVFWSPSRVNDDRNTYRIFHRDRPGKVIAEFYGDNSAAMAERFCHLFGQKDGSK